MLINHISPSPTASIGRSARYIESGTREASSITSIDTAENPRTVPSIPGSPTIRDRFGNTSDTSLSPSPRTGIRSLATISNHIPNRYVLSFQPQSPHPGLHVLSLSLPNYTKLAVTARTSYWADPAATTSNPLTVPH